MADADALQLVLITPEAPVLETAPELVVVPGAEGEFGVMCNHAPVMSALRPGEICVHATFDSTPERYFVSGGFAEAGPSRCVILADDATPVADIDAAAAKQAMADAEAAVQSAEQGTDEAARARAARDLAVAAARLEAAG